MRNIKFVSGFAICGFLLSFVFGLFSHSNFLIILLKALIFAVIFGALGAGIDVVFNKFLLDENNSDISNDSSGMIKTESNDSANTGNNSTKGRVIDFVVEDQELAPGESGNSFIVGKNHQMLNDSDVNKVAGNTEMNSNNGINGNNGFVPLRNFETVDNFSSTESENPDIMRSNENGGDNSSSQFSSNISSNSMASASMNESNDESLDVLPDMSYMEQENSSSESGDDSSEESGFGSSFATTTANKSNSDSIVGEMKDTALIAKAISSVLSQEST